MQAKGSSQLMSASLMTLICRSLVNPSNIKYNLAVHDSGKSRNLTWWPNFSNFDIDAVVS
uniref:Uncharacterized protein n=1 Tax=Rhizophora mucronata TaxID=61149 RepID=A0A2P2PA68_RHIMU